MPAPQIRTRETTDEEARARFRQRVGRTARTGLPPRDVYDEADLDWAFLHHEAELQELEEQAAQAPAAEAQQLEQRERSRALQDMTDRVLAEQDAERRSKAEAEAGKRLGWKKDERP